MVSNTTRWNFLYKEAFLLLSKPSRVFQRHFVDYISPTKKKINPTRQRIICCSKRDSKGEKATDHCNVVTSNGDRCLWWTRHSHVHLAAADKKGRDVADLATPFLTPEESNPVDRKMKERCFELTRERWPNDSSSHKLLDSDNL
ncbi:hypothetical protein TNCV_2466881 [Trichonephila clavipes]|nr:hypothetical protein TNCV_2466881 [Trichonephila clavipes]